MCLCTPHGVGAGWDSGVLVSDGPMRCTAYALFTLLTYTLFLANIVECE